MKKQNLRVSMILSALTVVCSVFVSVPLAKAESADDGACSNRTLRGAARSVGWR